MTLSHVYPHWSTASFLLSWQHNNCFSDTILVFSHNPTVLKLPCFSLCQPATHTRHTRHTVHSYYPLVPPYCKEEPHPQVKAEPDELPRPPSEMCEVNLDYIQAFEERRSFLPARPDILLLPSDLKPFVKVSLHRITASAILCLSHTYMHTCTGYRWLCVCEPRSPDQEKDGRNICKTVSP